MRRLICTFVVRIWHKTRFRMTWPIYANSEGSWMWACASAHHYRQSPFCSITQYKEAISLGLPEDFGSIAKKGVGSGFLDLKNHIICSSKKSCMETKADKVCFSLNSVFLIDPKNDDCAGEKDAHGFPFFSFFPPFFSIWSPIVCSFSSLFLLFLSFSLYHASFAPFDLDLAALPR